jgi:hypothetical protein
VRDLLFSAAVAALGAATILLARTFPSGKTIEMQPGFYPQVLGILLLILAGMLFVRTWQVQRTSRRKEAFRFSFSPTFKPLIVLGAMAGYWALLAVTGFIFSTVVALVVMVQVFGGDRRQALMTSLIATPLFYLVFRILFDVPLPRGLLEWL